MKMELPEIGSEERTPLVEALLGINRQLANLVTEFEETIRQLRHQNAVLKGQKPRPKISPRILNTPATTPEETGEGRRRGKPTRPKTSELTIHNRVPLEPPDLPQGAKLKGYESY